MQFSHYGVRGALLLVLFFLVSISSATGREQAAPGGGVASGARVETGPPAADLLKGSNIGYRIRELRHEGARSFAYKVALWYPTGEQEKDYEYTLGAGKLKTRLALESPVEKGAHPLVVYCHGAAGCGDASFFLAESLARKGYIVAAPDYHDREFSSRIDTPVPRSRDRSKRIWDFIYFLRDSGLSSRSRWGRTAYSYRPIQTGETLDFLLAENLSAASPFASRIDPAKIALIGHSFGAWTALLVAGADPSYARDDIRAVISLSGPANHQVYCVCGKNDLASIRVPVMFQYGGREKLIKRGSGDLYLFKMANSPKVLASIDEASHFDFAGGIPPEFDTARDYIAASPRRAALTNLCFRFLETYLRNRPLDPVLEKSSPGVSVIASSLRNLQDVGRKRASGPDRDGH
ncbi:MAG: alpha/beta hydrolase family protein [Candidatus Obscuribacterales bacterium]